MSEVSESESRVGSALLFPQLFDTLLHDDAIDVLAVNLRVNVPKPGGSAPSRQFSQAMSEALCGGADRLVVAFSSDECEGEVACGPGRHCRGSRRANYGSREDELVGWRRARA